MFEITCMRLNPPKTNDDYIVLENVKGLIFKTENEADEYFKHNLPSFNKIGRRYYRRSFGLRLSVMHGHYNEVGKWR